MESVQAFVGKHGLYRTAEAAQRSLRESPPDEVHIAADQEMLKAAYSSFGAMPASTEREDQDEFAKRVVNAFLAAGNARAQAMEVYASHGFDRNHEYYEIDQIVASAFYLWSNGIPIDKDCHPYSVAACRFLGFAQGIAAVRFISEADYLLSGEGSLCSLTGTAPRMAAKLLSFVEQAA